MSHPLKRCRIGLIVLAAISLVAVLGYRLAGWTWLDSVYMVVMTLSTVGYREMGEMTPALKVFTCLVIIFGVSTALYVMGGFVQMIMEGEINQALGMRRVAKEMERLNDHVIICGFGRMGEVLCGELVRFHHAFVVLEKNPEHAGAATALGYLTLNEDATDEEALLRAGVPRAKTLVTTLPGDADNVFITLTARDLNPKLHIIARGELRTTEKKLLQAGANRVVLPAAAGAMRMAAMVTRPSMVELIDLAAGNHVTEMMVDELAIPRTSPLVGCTVADSQARGRYGLLIVAIRDGNGQVAFNPGADTPFRQDDTVVALGTPADIERFRGEYRL